MEAGAKLTLCGGTAGTGTILANTGASDARGVTVNGTMVMDSGTISGFTSTASSGGGGILLNSNSTFTMNGGTISGNTAVSGGAIYLSKDASCFIKNGVLSQNSAQNGGAIRILTSGTLSIEGGRFLNNTATSYGGAIRTATDITITGGEFIGNSGGANKQAFNFSAATKLYNVTIECPDGGSVGKNAQIVSGTVNVDPSNNGTYNNVAPGSTYAQVGSDWVVTAG